jgi:hypothetical protein
MATPTPAKSVLTCTPQPIYQPTALVDDILPNHVAARLSNQPPALGVLQ